MWAFISILSLVVAATLINQFAAAHETFTTSFPPQVAQHLDLRVNPCNDFYKFACGGYSRSVQMPSATTAARYSVDHVQQKNRQVLLTMLKSNTPVVSKYFDSCMNTTRINALGRKPLQQVLEKIDAVKNVRQLFRVAGELSLVNFNFLVELCVTLDEWQATKNILQITRASLPLRTSDQVIATIHPDYRKYISTLLTDAQIANSATVDDLVDTIVHLEKIIANTKWSHIIDPAHSFNRMTFGQAFTKYPLTVNEVVTGMFENAGVPVPDHSQPIIIGISSNLAKLETLLASTKLSALQTLMKYHYIHAKKDLLGDQITAAAFKLHANQIKGVVERPAREKFCVDFVLEKLPNRMGNEYAALMFDTESANVAKDMFSRVEATLKQHLVQTDWLDNSTRKKALEKIAKVVKLIGYSEEVEQVNEETLSAGDFFGNTESIQRSFSLQQIQKLAKPVNRGEWHTAASEVNSYYNVSQNTVVVPAGILQPPFFSKSYPAAINYGSIATSMAHELIHVWDSSGRLYDGYGNRRSWWTKKTAEEFEKRTQCLVKQYSKFKVDGKATLVENFADVSGFALAFEAYQKFMERAKPQPTKQHEPLPEMDLNVHPQQEPLPEMDFSVDIVPLISQVQQDSTLTLTTEVSSSSTDLEKLFYIAYAQSWCSSTQAKNYLRVNGVIMNDQYFGNLFKCAAGTKMNPKDKCTVW